MYPNMYEVFIEWNAVLLPGVTALCPPFVPDKNYEVVLNDLTLSLTVDTAFQKFRVYCSSFLVALTLTDDNNILRLLN